MGWSGAALGRGDRRVVRQGAAAALLYAAVLAACGGGGGPGGGGQPGGGDAGPITVDAAQGVNGEVTVVGALYTEGEEVMLCSGLNDARLPPECLGATITLVGVEPDRIVGVSRFNRYRWMKEYVATGTLADGTLTVQAR